MSKNATRLLILLLLVSSVLITVAIMSGFGSPRTTAVIDNPIEISMTITYPEDAKRANVISTQRVDFSVEEGSTVLEAMQLYCNVAELPLTVDTTNNLITGIDQVMNDEETFMEWRFTLDGELQARDALNTVLSDGDTIIWRYLEDTDAKEAAEAAQAAADAQATEASSDEGAEDGAADAE